MSLSEIGHRDAESVLHSEEGGGGLKLINSGITPIISVVAYPESNGNSLHIRGFCIMRFHVGLLE